MYNNLWDGSNLFRKFWSCCARNKVLAFSWKLLLDRLPTCMNLIRRHAIPISHPCICVLCGQEHETASHLFPWCPFTIQVWNLIYRWLDFPFVLPSDIVSHYLQRRGLFRCKKAKVVRSLFWHTVVWSIWMLRNEVIFKNGKI